MSDKENKSKTKKSQKLINIPRKITKKNLIVINLEKIKKTKKNKKQNKYKKRNWDE